MNIISVNGRTIVCNGGNIVIRNNRLFVDGAEITIEEDGKNCTIMELTIKGNVRSVVCDCTVNVQGNVGNIECSGSCHVDGDVSGTVAANGRCRITGSVGGDVMTSSSVQCGNIMGSVRARGSIRRS